MRSMRLTALVLALIVLSFGTAWADTITLNPVDDVYWGPSTATVPVDNTNLIVGQGTAVPNNYARSALKFDLSGISDGSTINSATFYIYQHVYTFVTSLPTSQRGAILSYSANDTWTSLVIPAGGPVATTSLGDRSLSATDGWRTWELIARGWNPAPDLTDNFLSLRLDPENNTYASNAYFYSSTTTTSFKPYLLVDYTPPAPVPVPATMLLLGTGLVGLLGTSWRRRKKTD